LADLKYWRMSTKTAVCLKIWTVEQAMALCLARGFEPRSASHHGNDQIFFGATVTYVDGAGDERTVTILGIDEVDNLKGEISWVSPVARTLLKAREGDVLELVTPQGKDEIEVLRVRYPAPSP